MGLRDMVVKVLKCVGQLSRRGIIIIIIWWGGENAYITVLGFSTAAAANPVANSSSHEIKCSKSD